MDEWKKAITEQEQWIKKLEMVLAEKKEEVKESKAELDHAIAKLRRLAGDPETPLLED